MTATAGHPGSRSRDCHMTCVYTFCVFVVVNVLYPQKYIFFAILIFLSRNWNIGEGCALIRIQPWVCINWS